MVDGEVERIHSHVAQCLVKHLAGAREEMMPKRAAAADQVFPEARL